MRTAIRRALLKGLRTAAQAAAGILAGAGTGLLETDWIGTVSASGMAGLIAVLMNLGDAADQPTDAAA